MATADLLEPGNIDLAKRPVVKNPDGSISTVRSIGVNVDGQEVLIPTVSPDGRILSDKDAIQLYKLSGQHLGKFKTAAASTAYAQQLHQQQERVYAGDASTGSGKPFDVEGARAAGYTDAEIAGYLAKSRKFDLAGAQKAGYSDGEVINHLLAPAAPKSGADLIPGAGPAPVAAEEPGLGERAVGLGEAGLSTLTGLFGGLPFGVVNHLAVLGREIAQKKPGEFLSDEATARINNAFKEGQAALTYVPRTQAGKEAVGVVGDVAQNLAALGPAGEAAAGLGAAVSQGVRTAAAPVRATAAARAAARAEQVATATPAAVAAPGAALAPAAGQTFQTAEQLAKTTRTAADGGLGSKKATTTLASEAAPNPKTVAAAQRLGIEEHLQPDHVTTNQVYRELAQAVKSMPGSVTRQAEMQGLEQVAKRADDLVSEVGGTRDLSQLDTTVKGRMQAVHQDLEARGDALYQQIRDTLPARTEAPAPSVLAFIEQRAQDLGGAKNLTPLEKTIRARLTPKAGEASAAEAGAATPSQLRAEVDAASQRAAMVGQGPRPAQPRGTVQPTYALLDDVRKDVGAAARMTGPFKDADTGLAKKLYGLISDDQAAVVKRAGLGETYDAARQTVALRKGLEDDLASLFGKQLDGSLVGDLSSAVSALPKGDTSKLAKLLAAVPPELRQAVTASGLNTALGRAGARGGLNFNSYANWYEGLLRNKQAHSLLMSNLPLAARKQLSDLYRVADGIRQATRERITTGRIEAVRQQLEGADTLLANIYGLAKRAAVGLPAEAATTAIGLPGAGISAGIASALTKGKPKPMMAADALISSPEFVLATKAAGTPKQAPAVRRLTTSRAFVRFADALGSPPELANAERWVLGAMQAGQQEQQQRRD